MQTLIIDVLNEKALKLLKDLELLQLIRVRREKKIFLEKIDWVSKYKGAMSKQTISEIDNQLNELRSSWD